MSKITKTFKLKANKGTRAGIQFPVERIHRKLKTGNYAERIGVGASIYMASVLEYLVAELVQMAGNAMKSCKKSRINPKHILTGIMKDKEFSELLSGTIIMDAVEPS